MSATASLSLMLLALAVGLIGKLIFDIKFGIRERENSPEGELELVYRLGQPYFHCRMQYARAAQIVFGRERDLHIDCQYSLRLEESESGWQVRLEEQVTRGRGGPIDHKSAARLVRRINQALRNEQEYDLAADIRRWRVHEASDRCQLDLLPPLERFVPFSGRPPASDIVLTYQAGQPIFYLGSETGHCFHLYFGECWFDDFREPALTYEITLQAGETGWSARLTSTGQTGSPAEAAPLMGQQPRVLALVEAINQAMRDQAELDTFEAMQYWRELDENFSVALVSDEWLDYLERWRAAQPEPAVPPPPQEDARPASERVSFGYTPCLVMLAALAIVALLLFDSTSPLAIQKLGSSPGPAFGLLFLLMVILSAAAGSWYRPKQ